MGWCYYAPGQGPRTAAEVRAEITRMTTWQSDTFSVSPVEIGAVDTTWYVAARYSPLVPGTDISGGEFVPEMDGSYVMALVFLTRAASSRDGWGYKSMTEIMGPSTEYARAPKKILTALSPLVDGERTNWARRWRSDCAAWHARTPLPEGVVIETAKPITFTSGMTASRFKRASRPGWNCRKTIWLALDAGNRSCQIPETALRAIGFTVVADPSPPTEPDR